MTKLFVLGITGYIGGDAVHALIEAHPEYEMTAMLRDEKRGATIAAAYPHIKLVYGDQDNSALITAEAAKADIVLHMGWGDHLGSIRAIIDGLASTHTAAQPGFYLHTSGAASLFPAAVMADPSSRGTLPAGTHVYDDWDGLHDIYALPDSAFHHDEDAAVRGAGAATGGAVRTAVVAPPAVYGTSRSKGNPHSMIGPAQVRLMLQTKQGVLLGPGGNIWNECHVQDVAALFVLLVEEAVKGGGKATWDLEGYYLCETGERTQLERCTKMAAAAKEMGLIETTELKPITPEDADKIVTYGSIMLGSTSRGKSIRAKKLLGWEPKAPSNSDEIPLLVERVAKELGLLKSQ